MKFIAYSNALAIKDYDSVSVLVDLSWQDAVFEQ